MRERERGQEEDLHLSCIEVCMLKSPGIRGSDIGLAMCFTAVVNRCGELSLTKRFPELCAGPIGSDMCAAFLGANRDLHLTVSGAVELWHSAALFNSHLIRISSHRPRQASTPVSRGGQPGSYAASKG